MALEISKPALHGMGRVVGDDKASDYTRSHPRLVPRMRS